MVIFLLMIYISIVVVLQNIDKLGFNLMNDIMASEGRDAFKSSWRFDTINDIVKTNRCSIIGKREMVGKRLH